MPAPLPPSASPNLARTRRSGWVVRALLACVAFGSLGSCGGRAQLSSEGAAGERDTRGSSGGSADLSTGGHGTSTDTSGGGNSGAGMSHGTGGTGVQAIELSELCDAYSRALCSFYETCHSAPFRSREQCLEEVYCYGVPALVEAIETGELEYNPEAAGRCLNEADVCETLSITSGISAYRPTIGEALAGCSEKVISSREPGGSCASNYECPYRYNCFLSSCPGTCELIAGVNQPCRENDACYHPQVCLGGICHLLAMEGQTCSGDLDCKADLLCRDGICQLPPSRAGLGEFCIRDLNGAKPAVLCADGLFCTGSSQEEGICQPLLTQGALCSRNDSCASGLACVYNTSTREGHCQPPSDEGEHCLHPEHCLPGLTCREEDCVEQSEEGQPCAYGTDCQVGLICYGQICQVPVFSGEPCGEPNTRCVRSDCVDGACVAPHRIGDSCSNDIDCISNRCRDAVCVEPAVCLP